MKLFIALLLLSGLAQADYQLMVVGKDDVTHHIVVTLSVSVNERIGGFTTEENEEYRLLHEGKLCYRLLKTYSDSRIRYCKKVK